MNPVIVIPSYWSRDTHPGDIGELCSYDHACPVDKPVPELETCLKSLDTVRGVLRVVILLVAPADCEASARARVEGICRMHAGLNPLIVGSEEARVVASAVDRIAPTMSTSAISLRGYGAIRNLGLAVAAILGHDVVVFLDDDEVVLSNEFLVDGVYGLGLSNRQGLPIVAKTGYFIDRSDSPFADVDTPRWSERRWSKRAEFNAFMQAKLEATRVSRSSYVCGGCFAVSAEAFCQVPFDHTITRGEDLDYLFNLRMCGFDVWFDNQWCVRHLPPPTESRAARFLADVYRWTYEVKKLEVANSTIGLRRVTAEALEPYPGAWVSEEVYDRIRDTALRRAIVGPERGKYLQIYRKGQREALAWAERMADRYFAFRTYWPGVMDVLWDNELLARPLIRRGTARIAGARRRAKAEEGTT